MTVPEPAPSNPPVESDSRFPSGEWKGFFLQPGITGRNWMELTLTFRSGAISGEGRDRVGHFVFTGRYSTEDGRCRWTKRYLGLHDIAYQGFNEGKGIWGTWEDPRASHWRGGFRIWPSSMGDPYALTVEEEVPEPVLVGVGVGEETAVQG